jgi:predicted kinase
MKITEAVITPYSLICMVGPTSSGKSYWVNQLKEQYPNLRTVSSDEEREDILGIKQDKDPNFRYSQEMEDVSKAAFDILYQKVKSYCLL